ncbi:uncharacterized protein [Dermacentor andersoni]|uniref:uncharacterized protein n=1 Tax=Dermacentor andersoni TaxID=34620 RepID=UPI003B3AD213
MCQSDVRKGRPKARSQCRQGEAFAVTADVTEENADGAHIWTLTAPSNGRLPPPILRSFTWCGIDVPMIVDTGSPVCVVSKEIFEKNREHWPQLETAFIKLSCYLGELPVLGKLSMSVSYNDQEVKSSLMVLNCSSPSLCGRELISKFNDAGSSVLNVSVQQSSGPGSSRTPAIHAVLSEFNDVFSPELGLTDGHPVHLKLKEGTMPKFYHQPLVGLLKADRPTPALAAARIQRWALYFRGFRYQLQYSPGPANEADEWPLPLPEATDARNFGTGEKWTPGIVESTTGSRMVSIRTPAGSVRRHVDQVRNREDATPPLGKDQEAANRESTGTPRDYPLSPRTPAEQGGITEPEHELQPELAGSNAEPVRSPQALRRSTRQRKPVQRLQY